MNRYSFLFITLLASCTLTLSFGCPQTQAGLPVLSNIAKKAPHGKTRPSPSPVPSASRSIRTSSSRGVPVLGAKGDISPVKEKITKGSVAKRSVVARVADSSEVVKPSETSKVAYSRKKKTFQKNRRIRLPRINRNITSKSVVILDAKTGEIIFAKAPDNPRQPASTIKVLTGMIAMKRLKNNEKVEVSPHAEKMPRSKVYLSTKKKYKANDLINAVLLASANDA
ncbi:MAG: hypothetical protein D3904_18185, partial [Candidatus Electrothrix sp. EH2]|nr:hypothetical protein [Candidatus Electrothrix sp. EH2]